MAYILLISNEFELGNSSTHLSPKELHPFLGIYTTDVERIFIIDIVHSFGEESHGFLNWHISQT